MESVLDCRQGYNLSHRQNKPPVCLSLQVVEFQILLTRKLWTRASLWNFSWTDYDCLYGFEGTNLNRATRYSCCQHLQFCSLNNNIKAAKIPFDFTKESNDTKTPSRFDSRMEYRIWHQRGMIKFKLRQSTVVILLIFVRSSYMASDRSRCWNIKWLAVQYFYINCQIE